MNLGKELEKRLGKALEKLASDFRVQAAAISLSVVQETLAETLALNGNGKSTSAPRKSATKASDGKRVRRKPEELEALKEKLVNTINANPGSSVEQIGKALGLVTKEVSGPLSQLLSAKAISKKGQKRATRYFPASAKSEAPKKARKGKSK